MLPPAGGSLFPDVFFRRTEWTAVGDSIPQQSIRFEARSLVLPSLFEPTLELARRSHFEPRERRFATGLPWSKTSAALWGSERRERRVFRRRAWAKEVATKRYSSLARPLWGALPAPDANTVNRAI